ncbi:MAG: TatD family hydrolase [Actinomycetota bacterium]
MTAWIDSHCHLDSVIDLPGALQRARAAGVRGMITVGTDLETSRRAVEIAESHEEVAAAVGVHPHEAAGFSSLDLDELVELAGSKNVAALGEIGLDYYRELSPRSAQREAFHRQLKAAKELDLAVVIHVRDAHEDLFAILEEVGPPPRLVFHCFSGGPEEAARALALGGYVSFAGNISYKSAGVLREAASAVPPDHLLVETDSPYLAPMPVRGKPNEPALVPIVGAALAAAAGLPVEQVAEETRENARRVFRLDAWVCG